MPGAVVDAVADVHRVEAEHARLMTGQVVQIVLASPADFDAVRAFYDQLDDEATFFRFFGIRRHLPESELRAVVEASSSHVTLLASLHGRLIGIGEYIIGEHPTNAEVAFAVADDHHREGVATLLLERLALLAHDRGLRRFTATVLAENSDMQLVFRTVGLTTTTHPEDGVVAVTLDLASVVEFLAATKRRHPVTTIATGSTPRTPEHSDVPLSSLEAERDR